MKKLCWASLWRIAFGLRPSHLTLGKAIQAFGKRRTGSTSSGTTLWSLGLPSNLCHWRFPLSVLAQIPTHEDDITYRCWVGILFRILYRNNIYLSFLRWISEKRTSGFRTRHVSWYGAVAEHSFSAIGLMVYDKEKKMKGIIMYWRYLRWKIY